MREGSNTLPLFFCLNMVDIIEQAFDTLYERVMEMPNKVLDIFNNFFGEVRVDMQGFISKLRLVDYVLKMSVSRLFNEADMSDKLSIIEVNPKTELADVDFGSISEESISTIAEALLSSRFAECCKTNRNGFILVHFPRTVVTNEHDKSTVVNHIYIKVPITANGAENGLFTMNRSEYTVAEMYSNYMHSHASSIPFENFRSFSNCCLGSGPLRNTQASLSTGFDEDRWNIFCLELSKYVEVESITGTPYHYLEQISFCTSKIMDLGRPCGKANLCFSNIYRDATLKKVLFDFLDYYLDNNNLTFSFRNGVYSIGMSFTDYLINISNSFIEWVNKQPSLEPLRDSFYKVMGDYSVRGGEVYQESANAAIQLQKYRGYIGQEICTFKGRPITISITDIDRLEGTNSNNARLLNPLLASHFLYRILTTLNYRYGRNQEDPNTTTGKVRYQI